MRLLTAIHPGPDKPYTIRAASSQETWKVSLETVPLGGWKVCQIEVVEPITATFEKSE